VTEARPTVDPETAPLSGLRVLEFSHMVMGPACGLVLADLGAEVVRIEPVPDGDKTRTLPGSGAGFFPYFNRNKKSLAIDLKDPEAKDLVLRLCDTADVVFDNFGPGTIDRLGFGWEALSARNPRLIHCSLKGFLSGPYEKRTALDEVVQMMGGLAYMTGPPGQPLRAGASVIDIVGGMFGAIAILAAVEERHRTGKGQQVKSALFESCAFLVGQHIAQYAVTGQPARPMPVRLAAWAVYDVFDTADGGQVFVGIVTDNQWRRFCEAVDRPDWRDDPDLATNRDRVANRARFLPDLQALFGAMTADALSGLCESIGLPFAPIARPEDLLDDPHLAATGGLLEMPLPGGGTARLPTLPIELGGRRPGVRLPPRPAGADGAALLGELGLDEAAIRALAARGAVRPGD
jgi:crotonobetainyl-CoA:carnitine CoA-transferase CaiB-like acyl-CoA transferase